MKIQSFAPPAIERDGGRSPIGAAIGQLDRRRTRMSGRFPEGASEGASPDRFRRASGSSVVTQSAQSGAQSRIFRGHWLCIILLSLHTLRSALHTLRHNTADRAFWTAPSWPPHSTRRQTKPQGAAKHWARQILASSTPGITPARKANPPLRRIPPSRAWLRQRRRWWPSSHHDGEAFSDCGGGAAGWITP